MTGHRAQADAGSLTTEHSSLNREIADWREWWAELKEMGLPNFGEMGARLARFREHLAAHFEHEENEKSLALVEQLPHETLDRLAQLRDEHAGLLADLDHIVERLQACDPQFEGWSDARSEFDAFLTRLKAHENAEEAAYRRLK